MDRNAVSLFWSIPKARLRFALFNPLFDIHVLEFAGFEDFAAFLALDELRIFIAADDLHARMLAGLVHICALRRGGRVWIHKSGSSPRNRRTGGFAGIFRYFKTPLGLVKCLAAPCCEFVTRGSLSIASFDRSHDDDACCPSAVLKAHSPNHQSRPSQVSSWQFFADRPKIRLFSSCIRKLLRPIYLPFNATPFLSL